VAISLGYCCYIFISWLTISLKQCKTRPEYGALMMEAVNNKHLWTSNRLHDAASHKSAIFTFLLIPGVSGSNLGPEDGYID
jgi:hypothetical protein